MKQFFVKMQLALIALVAVSLPTTQSFAQTNMDLQPGVVISITNLEEHLSDAEYLVDAAGFGQMSGLVRMGASEYLRGLDTSKPLGAMLFFAEGTPEPKVLAFVPVTDIEDVLDTIAPFVDIDEDGDDIVITTDDGTALTIKQKNGYAFVSENTELFNKLPDNPVPLLEDMHSKYNIAAKVFGQRIPESLRNQAIEMIREGAEDQMEMLGDGPEAELQRANFKYSMNQLEGFINDTDEVLVGMGIDKENNRLLFDMNLTGIEGSRFARQCAAFGDAPPSKFGGFLSVGKSANMHFSGKMLEEDVTDMEQMVDGLKKSALAEMETELDEETGKVAKQVISEVVDLLKETLRDGVMDVGAALNLDENDADFAMGFRISDSGKLEENIKRIADIIKKEDPDAQVEFKFDVETSNGLRFHEVVIEIPEDEEEAREFIGSKLNVVIAAGDKVAYIAAGKSPKEFLMSAINASAPSEQVSGQVNINVAPILRFASKFQDEEAMGKMAEALAAAGEGKDTVRMTFKTTDKGQQFRLELKDGIIKMFGAAAQAFGPMGAPQDF